MSSNEEYLDQLLKAVEERESSEDALIRLQGEPNDTGLNYSLPQEEEEDILAELLAEGTEEIESEQEISFGKEDISESLLDELMDDIPETDTDTAAGTSAEEMPIFDSVSELIEVEDDTVDFSVDHSTEEMFFEAEEQFPEMVEEDAEEQFTEITEDFEDVFPAAEQEIVLEEESVPTESREAQAVTPDTEEEENEDEYAMSEEDIDALLSAAKESAEAQLRESSQGSGGMEDEGQIDDNLDDEDFSGLFEVDDLGLEEAEGEMVDDPDNFDNYLVEEDRLEEELQSQEDTPKKEKKKKKKKVRTDSGEEEGAQKKGLFGKIFHFLMEEVEDPEELEQMNLSQENKEILSQLDKEKAEKKKAAEEKKKQKKEEKEQKKQENKVKKEAKQKAKKEKKEQAREAKAQKEAGLPPIKPLPKKKVIISFIFSFSLMAVILLVVFLILPQAELSKARGAYANGDYREAYEGYYGRKLKEEDSIKFYGAETVLRMERNLDAYNNYMKMQNTTQALHSLIRAVELKDEIFRNAESYGVVSETEAVYSQILQILNQDYSISEEDARSIAAEESDVTYTKMLEALAGGTEYIEESEEGTTEEEMTESRQEDLLPEEEELFLESGTPSEESGDGGEPEEGGQTFIIGSENL
ncbi:MAG: hypothetical protein IJC59_06810 [Lachnospiraceae bacterium]|nr:hypothetical protein [Lachnospiraceae bacterium]